MEIIGKTATQGTLADIKPGECCTMCDSPQLFIMTTGWPKAGEVMLVNLGNGVPTSTSITCPATKVTAVVTVGKAISTEAGSIEPKSPPVVHKEPYCKPYARNAHNPHTSAVRLRACQLKREGFSYAAIDRALGVSATSVASWMKQGIGAV